ncbi:uncharacterized protein LOC132748919 [Ruditapes philippinarum]|uniref:uncharacterized protein LOC132748919 n=1 Tax=Ruditapes philippinarum TaxID=129788 RepID=UPI00295B5223|nr:uncharacterized protein LOC132748919 [Ruditapes philippinarum]
MAYRKLLMESSCNEVTQEMFENYFDNDIDTETDFVGRENNLNVLKIAWQKHKLFGIFGQKAVGKSRLVTEFLKSTKSGSFVHIFIDMKLIYDTNSLYSKICASYGIEPELQAEQSSRWIYHICDTLNAACKKRFIIFFDNTEDWQDLKGTDIRDFFFSLCTNLVRQCSNVKIFITSTTRVQFSQIKKVYCSHEVLPLNQRETRQLLKPVIEGVELGKYENDIADLCEGMPLLILMVGSELTEDSGMITPKDMVEFLLTCRLKALSREFYPKEDRVADVCKKFIDRLDTVYKRRLTILEYIPGSFNAEQAKEILNSQSIATVKDQTLIPIRRRHALNYDPNTRMFSIQGILRECIKTF